jgi:hypothetical protein
VGDSADDLGVDAAGDGDDGEVDVLHGEAREGARAVEVGASLIYVEARRLRSLCGGRDGEANLAAFLGGVLGGSGFGVRETDLGEVLGGRVDRVRDANLAAVLQVLGG